MDLDSDTVQDSFSTARQSSFQNQIKAEEETLWVRLTPLQVSYWSPISNTQFKIHFAQRHSSVSKTVFTLLSLLFGGPSLSITDQGWGRDFMGEADSKAGQLLVIHLLYTVQDPFSTARQPVSKTVFTLFSLFFGGPSLGTPDQGWGRDFMGEADSRAGQLLVIHLLYTVQDPFSAARQFSFKNNFHSLLFVFWWTKS